MSDPIRKYGCNNCNYFNSEFSKCILRDIIISDSDKTTCESCNKMHKVPKGPTVALIEETINGNIRPRAIPYYFFGDRPRVIPLPESGDTHIQVTNRNGEILSFNCARDYEDHYDEIYTQELLLVGAIAGDIIGSVYEMHNIKTTDFKLFTERSRYTDDTVLTLAIADSIISSRSYEESLLEYAKKYRKAGFGPGFKKWFNSQNPEPYNSYGNGSAMRVSPIAYAFEDIDTVLDEAKKSAEVTHNHPEGIKGAQAVAAAIFLARNGKTKKEIKEYIFEQFGYDLNRKIETIRETYQFDISCQGSVPEAIIAFLESSDLESAIRLAISIGGDSDTIASIAGAIAEAYYKDHPEDGLYATIIDILPDDLLGILFSFSKKYYSEIISENKKKALSMIDYLDLLMERSNSISRTLKEYVLNKEEFSGEERRLDFDAKVFGIWVVSLCIEDSRIKDIFHQQLCEKLGFDSDEIRVFYEQIKIRYQNYNFAYTNWANNPQNGSLLGGVITESIINQNPYFNIEEEIPIVDGQVALEMFMYFGEAFKATLDMVKRVKDDYILPVLN